MSAPTPQYADLEVRLREMASYPGSGPDMTECEREDVIAAADAIRDLSQRCEELSKKWKASFDANARLTEQKAAVLKLCDEAIGKHESDGCSSPFLCGKAHAYECAKIALTIAPPRSDAEQERPA